MRILLIDDIDEYCDIVRALFNRGDGSESVVVEDARTVEDALAILNKDSDFDLIISDYEMAPSSGGDLYKRLKGDGFSIPFILFTSMLHPPLEEFTGENFLGAVSKMRLVDLKFLVAKHFEAKPAPR